jgi:hypothetical protein
VIVVILIINFFGLRIKPTKFRFTEEPARHGVWFCPAGACGSGVGTGAPELCRKKMTRRKALSVRIFEK